MNRKGFYPSRLFWLAIVILASFVLTAMTIVPAHTTPDSPEGVPGAISGVLYEPDGATPVSSGWIDIRDSVGDPWMGTATQPDGTFAILNLPPGEYTLRAYPPQGNPYAGSLPLIVTVFAGQFAPAELHLTEVRVAGYVRDCDASPEQRIPDAPVVVHNDSGSVSQWDVTKANGEFKLGGVEIGVSYIVEVMPPPGSEYVPSGPIPVTPISTTMVIDLCVPPINVVGTVADPAGAPVSGAGVAVYNDSFWRETAADEFGDFHLRGLPVGEYWIHAAPPWDVTGLIASEPFTFVITAPHALADVGTITLPHANKTVSGTVVLAGSGTGVPAALVWANRLDAPGYAETATGAGGAFNLSLVGGAWHVSASPLDPAAEWLFLGPPEWVVFEPDTVPQTATVTLEAVPTNAWVTGRIVCPGGSSCTGDPWHEEVWVELRNDDVHNEVPLAADYTFAIPILDGWYELVVHLAHPLVQGPVPIPVYVGPGQTLDLGDLELLVKDALLIGRVYDEFGQGASGIPLFAWNLEGFGWGWAETDATGVYTMPVVAGQWVVEPQPPFEIPYVFNQEAQIVRVAPGGVMVGLDFALTYVDALIDGVAVDAVSHEPLWWLNGWAWSEIYVGPPDDFQFFSDGPMWYGSFLLKARGGEQYAVGVGVPPEAPYVSSAVWPVSTTPGDVTHVEVPLVQKDAAIAGVLIDAVTGLPPVEPVWAEIVAEDEAGHWSNTEVDPFSHYYALPVISGTWHLRAFVDPDSGYVASPEPIPVTVQSGEVVPQFIPIWPVTSRISGVVLAPDGSPVEAYVFAEGASLWTGYFETATLSGPDGSFELIVPEGIYLVGAALPEAELAYLGWINPPPIDDLFVTADDPATGLVLQFNRLDGEIRGTIDFTPTASVTAAHPAYVWGWSESGHWAETEASVVAGTNTFTYTMQVVSGTVWHIGAVYQDWDRGFYYESAEAVVPVPASGGQAVQDLTLNGPLPLPQLIIVSFDATQMQTIVMPDGVALTIPPGAMATSGTVTLFIFPTQELRPEPGLELIGAGYEMWAVDQNGQEITHFNENVLITFSYPDDVVLQAQGISEQRLIPLYYSTLVGQWILAEGYVVDTDNNEIGLWVNHFTKFSVAAPEAGMWQLFLPITAR